MPHPRKTVAFLAARLFRRALAELGEGEIGNLARMLARRNGFDESDALALFARDHWRAASEIPNLFELNGEKRLLEATAPFGFATIFDVGANAGHWTQAALAAHPGARVHCFEIVPATFLLLERTLAAEAARVRLNAFGLADREADIMVNVTASNLVSSLYRIEVPEGEARSEVPARVRQGDSYAEEAGIGTIDLLKIDVEGAEGRVLEGFKGLLSQGRVGLIQFEYNRAAVLGGFLLRYAYEMLEPLGYALGRLTPAGVVFRPYRVEHEDFTGPNYVACHRSRPALMAALAAG